MKKAVLSAAMILSLVCPLFAIDEDTYVQFVTDSIVIAHKYQGSPDAASLWSEEIRTMYPSITAQDVKPFEEALAGDGALKEKVYNRILEIVRSRGYKAHISNLGTGQTAVEIED